jgi:hypothetical protein
MQDAFRRGHLFDAYELLNGVPPDSSRAYLAKLGADPALVAKRCGRVWTIPGRHPGVLEWGGREELGKTHVICELLDFDGETPIGLVTWPMDEPAGYYIAAGTATLLGLANIEERPKTDVPLRVHRTPERWLAASGEGVVIMTDQDGAALASWPGWFEVEDREHAWAFNRIVLPFLDLNRILVRGGAA